MKKRIVSLLLALALLVLPVDSAGAAQPAAADPTPVQTQTDAAAESDQHCYSYIALGDSIVAGIGLPDAVYQRNGRYYDVSGNYQGYSKDCYVARVADSLGLSRAQTANYGMPALMSSDLLELVRTGSCQSASINFSLPDLREELKHAQVITVEIGANDVLVPIMYGIASAMGGPQVFEALLPMLEGDFRQMDASSFAALRENLDSLNITAQQRKALLQLLSSGVADICAQSQATTLLIGSNDTVLQLMGAMGRATNGKATKLLIPLLTGTMRELNLQTLQTLKKGLENLDLTPEELKAALKLLDSGMEEICDQTRDQTVANVEQILQELRALNPDAQIILVGYYNPLPFLPTYGRHFRLLNRSVKALAQQYGADYVSIPYTSIANDGHPTVCGHKYIARQILKAVRK